VVQAFRDRQICLTFGNLSSTSTKFSIPECMRFSLDFREPHATNGKRIATG
jgi:hypothetical protein